MNNASRIWALIAYLLSIPGAIIALLARRNDAFVAFHARQSFAIGIAALLAPLVWAVVAFVLAWIPTVGAMAGVALFALVIAAELALLGGSVVGAVNALRGLLNPVPLVGERALARPVVSANAPAEEVAAEVVS